MAKRKSVKDWKVMPAKCKTCPFGPDGDPRIRESVTERIFKMEASQICHHPALHGKEETHLCRGARDLQLQILCAIGLLPEATDAAFKKRSDEVLGTIQPTSR